MAYYCGLGMYQDKQGLLRQFYKEQCKGREEGANKRRVGRITGLKFSDTVRESENKIKWRERVARSICGVPTVTMTTG